MEQHVGDHQPQHAVAEKFQALVALLEAASAGALSAAGWVSASPQLGARSDDRGLSRGGFASPSQLPSSTALKKRRSAARAATSRAPKRRPLGREEQEIGAADEVLRRHVKPTPCIGLRAHDAAVERVVAVVAHGEVGAGRYLEHRRVVADLGVGALAEAMGDAAGQRLDVGDALRKRPSSPGRNRRCRSRFTASPLMRRIPSNT